MRFADFIGNNDSVERLRTQVKLGRDFHTYIFEGAEGVGKRTLAMTFAQALMCEEPVSGEPCCACPSCRKVMSGNHTELHYYTKPEGKSGITMEVLEKMQPHLNSKPMDGNRTVIIIDDADTMNPTVQNKLLKTLEEPIKGLTIILLAARPGVLLPTIASRSALIRLKPVDREEIRQFISINSSASEEEQDIAASYCGGNPGRALRLADTPEFFERRNNALSCARVLVENRCMADFTALIEGVSDSRDSAAELLEMMVLWYRDLMLAGRNMDRSCLTNGDRYDELKRVAGTVGEKKICRCIEVLEAAKADVVNNFSVKYVLKNIYLEIN